jgi:hypothetical protein
MYTKFDFNNPENSRVLLVCTEYQVVYRAEGFGKTG